MSDRATTDYLRGVLALDPALQVSELLELRRAWRTAGEDGPRVLTREELAEQLDTVAGQLMEEDPATLRATLTGLDLQRFPDLARRCEQLLRVVEVSGELSAAKEDTRLDRVLVKDLVVLLTSEPRLAAERRRKALLRLDGGRARRAAAKTVRRLEKDYPGLASLEEDFLGQVRRARREIKDRRRPATLGFGCFGLYVLLQIVKAVVRAISE